MKLGDKLYLYRVAKRYNQQYVAERVGVTKAMVSFYEKNKNIPSKNVLKKYAELFNTTEKELTKDINNIRIYEKLDGMTNEEKIKRKKEQEKKARQKYYLKNKKKFHQYYVERKKRINGISGSEK